ncbi:MAG: hypothetical protein AAFQ17_07090, partial [Pseudomonadota bacterium]
MAVPTTGGVALIANLRRRARLKASYVTTVGDYRPLSLSPAYEHLLIGPLAEAITPGPYEIVLSSVIETGRSWELPVTIAHLFAEGQVLAKADGPPDALTAYDAGALVWATGKLDTSLTPVPDDYRIDLKVEHSMHVFEEAHAASMAITLIVPAGTDPRENAALDRVVSLFGAELIHADDGFEVEDQVRRIARVVGADLRPNADTTAADHAPEITIDPTRVADGSKGGSIANHPSPEADVVGPATATDDGSLASRLDRRWLFAGAVGLALAAVALWFGSGLSTSPSRPASDDVTLRALRAADMAACQGAILQGTPMDAAPVERERERFVVSRRNGLCGLTLKNESDNILRFRLDARLVDQG